ncbi:MAG: site-2 protease family protein [Lachnospiraceae bacterium]|nr:site-2 protease family protein [Lachnospiraceae bacterium]
MSDIVRYIVLDLGFYLIIFFHELGHYMVARWTKFTVESFELGIGPKLLAVEWKKIKYTLRMIPFAGACTIKEFDVFDETTVPKTGVRKHYLKKMAIIIAGPIMSVVLAFLLMLSSQNVEGLRLLDVKSQALAEAGIQQGDVIRSVNGTRVFREEDMDLLLQEGKNNFFTIEKASGDRTEYTIYYSGENLELFIDDSIKNKVRGSVNMFSRVIGAVTDVFKDTLTGETSVAEDLSKSENSSSAEEIPMGIRYDLNKCIIMLSIFSLSVCFFNLLPIIFLDGFRFITSFLAFVRGRGFVKKEKIVIGILGIVVSLLIIF